MMSWEQHPWYTGIRTISLHSPEAVYNLNKPTALYLHLKTVRIRMTQNEFAILFYDAKTFSTNTRSWTKL